MVSAAPVELAHVSVISRPSVIRIAGVCSLVRIHHKPLPYSGTDGHLHPSLSYSHSGEEALQTLS